MSEQFQAEWTRFEDTTREDWAAVAEYEKTFNAGLVDRLLAQFQLLDETWTPYPVNRYQHSLQTATRAWQDGADEEVVVAALLHDIGDVIAPYNHCEVAAAILKPYVSEKTWWIVKHHGVFQGYYYNHHFDGDRHARDKYRDHPFFEAAVHFCHNYDQCAFDPAYVNKPLAFFEPMLRRVFGKTPGHLELAERHDDQVA